jgi:FtsP/CotA-like multicopper oxidase with cupredoxin domain
MRRAMPVSAGTKPPMPSPSRHAEPSRQAEPSRPAEAACPAAPEELPSRRDVLLGIAAGVAALEPLAAAAQAAPVPAAAAKADGVPTTLLEAKPAFVEFTPGKVTELWAFGGVTPGPELRLRKGEEFRLKLVNSIGQPTSVHWHGMRVANEADGVAGLTQDAVPAGASGEIRFTPPDAGTFIYRPATIGLAAQQAERGMAGVVVVEETSPVAVDLDKVIAVDDWRLAEDGQVEPFGAIEDRAGSGRLGNVLTVNGARSPLKITAPPGARIRLRIANLCGARIMRIRFDGLKAYVVSVDGQPTDTFEPLRSILPFAPGSRYEVIADLPLDPGITIALTALIGQGMPLAQIVTDGPAITQKRPALPPVAPLGENRLLPGAIPLEKSQRVDLVIEGGGKPGPDGRIAWSGDPARIYTVNGVPGATAPDRAFGKPLVSVKRGTPVVIAIANRTAGPKVLHVHGHCFRLLHALDDGWEPYWLDTMIMPENQTARIVFVADNKGKWLIGSSILEHLDAGLSTWFEVT